MLDYVGWDVGKLYYYCVYLANSRYFPQWCRARCAGAGFGIDNTSVGGVRAAGRSPPRDSGTMDTLATAAATLTSHAAPLVQEARLLAASVGEMTGIFKRRFAKISKSPRRPLPEPSPGAPTSASTFKNLLRHYAKRVLTPK